MPFNFHAILRCHKELHFMLLRDKGVEKKFHVASNDLRMVEFVFEKINFYNLNSLFCGSGSTPS